MSEDRAHPYAKSRRLWQPRIHRALCAEGERLGKKWIERLMRTQGLKTRSFKLSYAVSACLLCLAWLIPGLVGHDPWKPDEAYSFGVVYHIIKSGDWVVPILAGEPFMEKPPLFYLSAAVFGWLFSPPLALPDAARLATGFYMGLTLLFIALSGRELYGKDHDWIAALILIGCLGLLVRMHQLITDVSLLTGFALGLYGLSLSLRRAALAGALLGTGVGVGFMSKGLIAPGLMGLIALLLPVCFKAWRTRGYALCLGIALIATLPWLAIWPYALYQRSPELFMEWLWDNNVGRFLGLNGLGPKEGPFFYLTTLPWFAWPALPLALWTLWQGRFEALRKPGIQLPLLAFLIMLAVLSFASDAREVYGLPLLLPLTLLAGAGVDTLRRGASSALDWFGTMSFGLIAGMLWVGWIMFMTGFPEGIAASLDDYLPSFTGRFSGVAFTISLVVSALWLTLMSRTGRSNHRPIINWAGGMTLIWILAMTLWLPWLDAEKSYRSMIVSMQQALPSQYRCISSRALGESQRAMLEYYAGIITQRVEISGRQRECDLLLTQGSVQDASAPEGPWQKIWEGSRPGDNVERYRLYRRTGQQMRV